MTDNQRKILELCRRKYKTTKRCPSTREIAAFMGWDGSARATDTMASLAANGYVTATKGPMGKGRVGFTWDLTDAGINARLSG